MGLGGSTTHSSQGVQNMSGKVTIQIEQKDLMALIMAGKVVTRLWTREGLKRHDSYSMQRAVDNAFDAMTDEMLGFDNPKVEAGPSTSIQENHILETNDVLTESFN